MFVLRTEQKLLVMDKGFIDALFDLKLQKDRSIFGFKPANICICLISYIDSGTTHFNGTILG